MDVEDALSAQQGISGCAEAQVIVTSLCKDAEGVSLLSLRSFIIQL